jgi:hypothetical protein
MDKSEETIHMKFMDDEHNFALFAGIMKGHTEGVLGQCGAEQTEGRKRAMKEWKIKLRKNRGGKEQINEKRRKLRKKEENKLKKKLRHMEEQRRNKEREEKGRTKGTMKGTEEGRSQ